MLIKILSAVINHHVVKRIVVVVGLNIYYITNPGINQGKETIYCICLTSFHVKKLCSSLKNCAAVVKEKAVETTAGCILRLKINIAVLDINGEAWYNVTKISAYQSK